MTYSQHGEEDAILRWAAERPGPGSFLDLGCYDGTTYSNTAALAALGWGGLCIDAAPDALAACALHHQHRPAVRCVLGALDLSGHGEPGTPALIHWSPGAQYSSLLKSQRSDTVTLELLVPRLSAQWLLHEAHALPRPLFASIDLEGHSLTALHWLLEVCTPDAVCCEANTPGDRAEVQRWLLGWRQLGANQHNLVYARP